MKQGDPVSPTIFNVVVDAVVQYWVTVMVESTEERSRRRQEDRHQNALFYADDGMVVSSDLRWLQGDFSTLLGLFYRAFLKANVVKTVGMVFQLCQAVGMQLEAVCGVTDDRSGEFLLGEVEGSGTLHRVRGGYGARVAGGPPADS